MTIYGEKFMIIIDELQKIINEVVTRKGTEEELSQETTKFIISLDYQDEDIRTQSDNFVKNYIQDYIVNSQETPYFLAKTIHCMITKQILNDRGLDEEGITINYSYRTTPEDFNREAYYLDTKKSINFYNELVASTDVTKQRSTPQTIAFKLDHLAHQIFVIEHEIQHFIQNKNITNSLLSPKNYAIERQWLAKKITEINTTKYSGESIYSTKNHDFFHFEADAHLVGAHRTLALLKKLSPNLEISDSMKTILQNKIAESTRVLNNSPEIGISHKSNPNNSIVSTNHKCNIILDELLPKFTKEDRETLFKEYSSLKYTYNPDGSKKTLEQVEHERDVELSKAQKGTPLEVASKTAKLNRLYETVIESDPTLSFEYCLRHIAKLSSNSQRYFTDNGDEITYDPEQLTKELRTAGAKASILATYLETAEAKDIKKLMHKYKKEMDHASKRDITAQALFENKKLIMFSIESSLYKNAELRETYKKEMESAVKKHKEKEQATEIIKKVFPGFTPQPRLGFGTVDKIQFVDNHNEKLLLTNSLEEYRQQMAKQGMNASNDQDFIPISIVRDAINKIYPFDIPEDKKTEFEEKFNNGELELIGNKYTPQPEPVANINTQDPNPAPQSTPTQYQPLQVNHNDPRTM